MQSFMQFYVFFLDNNTLLHLSPPQKKQLYVSIQHDYFVTLSVRMICSRMLHTSWSLVQSVHIYRCRFTIHFIFPDRSRKHNQNYYLKLNVSTSLSEEAGTQFFRFMTQREESRIGRTDYQLLLTKASDRGNNFGCVW